MHTRPHIIPAATTPPAMTVSHFDGDVTVALSPALARDLASIWAQAHAGDPLLDQTRPRWHDDVIALISHAARAEQQADAGPVPVEVPVLELVPAAPDVVEHQANLNLPGNTHVGRREACLVPGCRDDEWAAQIDREAGR